MKVILLKQVKKLGNPGDAVDVSDGYGLNFLLPQGLAELATEKAQKHIRQVRQSKMTSAKKDIRTIRDGLAKVGEIVLHREAKEGKLFGSVTSKDVAEALKETGVGITEKDVLLEHPIKEIGRYTVGIQKGKENLGSVTLSVEEK